MKSITLTEKYIVRFWKKVDKKGNDECWEWTAGRNKKGYGVFSITPIPGNVFLAPRVSWVIHHGSIPDNLFVLHTCDNPPCVNPKHLFLGTTKDNAEDMVRKGRSKLGKKSSFRGELVSSSKLSEEDVCKIKEMLRNGVSCASISRKYNVTPEAISRIKVGQNWSWVK